MIDFISRCKPHFRPLLVFSKGVRSKQYISDYIKYQGNTANSNGNKELQYSSEYIDQEVSQILEQFTNEGEIVCYPALGWSNTLVSTLKKKRRFVGFATEKEDFNSAAQKLAKLKELQSSNKI